MRGSLSLPSLGTLAHAHRHTHSHSHTAPHHGGSGCSGSEQTPETFIENSLWILEKTQRGEGKRRGGLFVFTSNYSKEREMSDGIAQSIPPLVLFTEKFEFLGLWDTKS